VSGLSSHMNPAGTPAAERILYLFCFATLELEAAAPGIAGLSDLVLHRCGDLIAVCGWTEREQWSGPQGERNLGDLQWLGPRVMRHQAAIAAAMGAAAVFPARLGTLFSSPDALSHFMAIHQRTIAGFLHQTKNHDEWALKGLLDRTRAGDWQLSKLSAAQTECSAAPGANYLRERRTRAAAAKELNRWVARTLECLIDDLRRYAAGFHQRDVCAMAEPGAPQTVVNLAFLIARDAVSEFQRRVEQANLEHREHGLELAVSGPWPPYSFCPALETGP
jgi:hypothetical protein